MSGGKGGSSKSKVTIPKWIEEPAIRNIARAEDVAQMGYQPYYGPEVAAFNPMQTAAMQSAADAASAFGLAPQMDVTASIPQATEYAGGIRGYGSGDIFEQSVNEFQKRQPDQAELYNQQFVGPDAGSSFYDQPQQRPVSGIYGGGGGYTPLTGGYDQYGVGYNPYGGAGQFTDYSNSNSTFNPFSGQGIPVVAGSGVINPASSSPSGGSAPVDMNRPLIPGDLPNGHPTTPSNPSGIPVNNDLAMYGGGFSGMTGGGVGKGGGMTPRSESFRV